MRAGGERLEEALLLRRAAVEHQQLHVAHVGRLAVEGVMAERRAAELFADERVVVEREPHAPEVAREKGSPDAEAARPLADALERGQKVAKACAGELRFERDDLVADELAHAQHGFTGDRGRARAWPSSLPRKKVPIESTPA